MTLVHSCCPGKTDIYAPAFRKTETLHISKGSIEVYECVGCRTVVMVEKENEGKYDAIYEG